VVRALRELPQAIGDTICFKDSFCEFDQEREGFRALFRAEWIWSPPGSSSCPKDWNRLYDPRDLHAWEMAWNENGSPTPMRMFCDELLGHPDIAVFGTKKEGEFIAGCTANRSADCVGISNIFCKDDLLRCVGKASDAIGAYAPGLPIVGYATGAFLQAAEQSGFCPVGKLQILLAERAHLEKEALLY
jgi:hypothetical protein